MAIIAVVVAIPVLGYFLAPLRKKSEVAEGGATFADAGPVADFPLGQWRLAALESIQEDGWKKTRVRHSAWIRRQGEGTEGFTVLSTICPHLGCPVNWHPDQSKFICPCHGGVFSEAGRQVSGPPPRNMDSLDFEVQNGRLWIRWQDFKIGIAERIPVNL
jgi:menaquinol-cytochrome c reductase iron-sulfur subunit